MSFKSQAEQDAHNEHPENKHANRFKTEMCRAFMERGACKYGEKCQYAHGQNELRFVPRHPKYKTELCRTFHESGLCPYGKRCHFVHNPEFLQFEVQDLTVGAVVVVSEPKSDGVNRKFIAGPPNYSTLQYQAAQGTFDSRSNAHFSQSNSGLFQARQPLYQQVQAPRGPQFTPRPQLVYEARPAFSGYQFDSQTSFSGNGQQWSSSAWGSQAPSQQQSYSNHRSYSPPRFGFAPTHQSSSSSSVGFAPMTTVPSHQFTDISNQPFIPSQFCPPVASFPMASSFPPARSPLTEAGMNPSRSQLSFGSPGFCASSQQVSATSGPDSFFRAVSVPDFTSADLQMKSALNAKPTPKL